MPSASFTRSRATPWVHRYPANNLGRDFVVGDLHGCVLAFLRALEALDFHPYMDRVFSVGDLVDRGPHSMECLRLLKRPWFRATRGNHEELLINHLRYPDRVAPREDDWLNEEGVTLYDRLEFAKAWLPTLEALPLLIVVGEGADRFNVVHAELLDHQGPVTDTMIDGWRFLDGEKAQDRAIWGRALIKTHRRNRSIARAHHPKLLSTTYCGHSIVDNPLKLGSQVYLDQGAFLAFQEPGEHDHAKGSRLHEPGLIFAEPKEGRFWLAPSDPTAPMVLRPITLSRPTPT